ncbi:amino acid ABC transporter substrate-binding protein [Azospirillum canadense]|uniref:amino acid ABC transporter substrate-binding protein n=1 Tax=Azospirillum canadense TaxID=403962 RepID=UPI0022275C08|nr:amino acid ABC transporter substrate-binding protein [Azospirillum canadense]MCW2241847.1 general L-amino acid transport system substrate-binding protein [Azospirillum canadense]
MLLVGTLLCVGEPAEAGTLERVHDAGLLRCGVTASGRGLSTMDQSGRWEGFYTDMCRALAAAVAGGADRVDFVEVTSANRFDVLRRGEVDVVMGATTWTQQRDTTLGVNFPVVYLYDGQSFMAHRSSGIASLMDLAKLAARTTVSVCVVEHTTSMRNLEAWLAQTGTPLATKRTRSSDGALSAFFNHHCDLITNDRIGLYGKRLDDAPNGDGYVVFPEVISKEPLGPMVRADDKRWFDIVRWVVLATVLAEEKRITAANAEAMKASDDAEVRKLLGGRPGFGSGLGLDDAWGWRVITQVGNYGEIYDRHLGKGSALGIERGPNALWINGGLLYAPPLGE